MNRHHHLNHRVAIAGGGPVGLLCALAARRVGHDVQIIDPMPLETALELPFDGRGLAVMNNRKHLFETLGIWSQISQDTCPVRIVHVHESRSGETVIWHAEQAGVDCFCHGMTTAGLRKSLSRLIEVDPDIYYRTDRVAAFQRSSKDLTLTLENDDELGVSLLIGCDGKKSQIAQMMGQPLRPMTYGQSAVTFSLQSNTFDSDTIHLFLRAEGPLAILPVAPDIVSVTWTDKTNTLNALSELSSQEQLNALGEIFAHHAQSFPKDVQMIGKWQVWPISAHCHERITSPRLTLAGDAAHSVHPILAQGFNLGVDDVDAMTKTIFSVKDDDPGNASRLRSYQHARLGASKTMVRLTDLSAHLVLKDFGILESLRKPLFKAMGRFKPANRMISSLGTRSIPVERQPDRV